MHKKWISQNMPFFVELIAFGPPTIYRLFVPSAFAAVVGMPTFSTCPQPLCQM
jgi:hypothetical protein